MAHVLVIDDAPHVRQVLCLLLEGAGHTAAAAAHGGEGLKAAAASPPDLILCDLFMPEVEGPETIQELRQRYPAVKVIAMTGGSAPGYHLLEVARSLGAVATLAKPFDADTLLRAVTDALARG